MEIADKILRYAFIGLLAGIVVLVLVGAVKRSQYESQLLELRNAVASRDVTIETQKGVYQKLSLQSKDLTDLLDKKDVQIQLLEKELKKGHEDLLTANTVAIQWKKAYEASVKGNQTEQPPVQPGGVTRKKVEFEKDFGYIGVNGWTLTDPPEAYVKIQQNRPLRVTVAVSQDRDGTWKSRATSSEENVGVDITLAAVNPFLLEPKWYEGIGVSVDLGVSSSGFLGGAGVSYKISKFEVGPKAWFTATGAGGVQPFFGAGLTWHPFQR